MAKVKRESNKKFLILLLIVLLLVLAIGYAAFSDTLTISGKASAKGNFDMQFVVDNPSESIAGCKALQEIGCTANVQVVADSGEPNDKMLVTVSNLSHPGAGAEIRAVVKNVGTIPATVKSVSENPTGNGNAIRVSGLNQITSEHPTIQPGDTCTFTFTVDWNPAVTTLDATKAGERVDDTSTSEYSFELDIEYEQDASVLDTAPSHT